MPTDKQLKEQFAKDVRRITRELYRLEGEALRKAIAYLKDLRRDVLAQIAASRSSEFSMAVYRTLKASIDYRIAEFERDLAASVGRDISRSFDLGVRSVDEPLVKAFSVTPPVISREAVLVATQYSADLISSLATAAKEKVNSVLRRAALGAVTLPEAMKIVGSSVDKGAFKSVSARAETIVRTEVLRIFSIAAHARQVANKDAAEAYGYATLKEWSATSDLRVRATHLTASGQLREVEKPFAVGGEALLYPRDPAGSAKETINCRCSSITRMFLLSEVEAVLASQSHALAA